MMQTKIEAITPEMAKHYLKHNVNNRKTVRSANVEALMRDMKAGKFRLTHQGIAFDSNGNLVDGQHRLIACALSGVTIQILVTREMPDEAKEVIDTGMKRTFRDLSDIRMEDSVVMRSNYIVGSVRQMFRFGGVTATDYEIRNYMHEHEELVSFLYNCAYSNKGSGNCFMSVSIGAALLTAMMSGEKYDAVRKFCNVYVRNDISGCELYNVSAVLNLRTQIEGKRAKGMSVNRTKMFNLAMNAFWNFAKNTKTRTIKETDALRYNVEAIVGKLTEGQSVKHISKRQLEDAKNGVYV